MLVMSNTRGLVGCDFSRMFGFKIELFSLTSTFYGITLDLLVASVEWTVTLVRIKPLII